MPHHCDCKLHCTTQHAHVTKPNTLAVKGLIATQVTDTQQTHTYHRALSGKACVVPMQQHAWRKDGRPHVPDCHKAV
jgi:hypothetical protein